MPNIFGLKIIAKIYESPRTVVYRGLREADQKNVIIKMLNNDKPPERDIARLKREFDLVSGLKIEGVVKALTVEPCANGPALIFEDFGGESLRRHLNKGRPSHVQTLRLAIRCTEYLERFHHRHIIHKDINPANIIWNPNTDQVKIIDFGIAALLSQETSIRPDPDLLEGSLPYISPEQTGRMNRRLDYRSDFYSLGATLYELLTGRVPFLTSDPLAAVHAHIAQIPVPPSQLDPSIPEPIAKIVLKLLAKNAEDRYQSAFGLISDLEACLTSLQNHGVVNSFEIGANDVSERFWVSEKLYGRQEEVDQLLSIYSNISSGFREVAIVRGESGIGKSSLVRAIHRQINEIGGHYASGTFDFFKRHQAYSAIISALEEFLQQILTEPEDVIQEWRQRIERGLAEKAEVLAKILPSLGIILGRSAGEVQVQLQETYYHAILLRFIKTVASAKQPLTLFLDDLQWADLGSLSILRAIAMDSEVQGLFLICSLREQDLEEARGLKVTLEEMEEAGITIHTIFLDLLEEKDVNQLIADTLHRKPEQTKSLAEICYHRTQGNPFYLFQYLMTLHEEGLIYFASRNGCWEWDTAGILSSQIQDSLANLMANKLKKLSLNTQKLLSLAACIGMNFDLQTLSLVAGTTPINTSIDLWDALVMGLVIPANDAYHLVGELENVDVQYRFLHERVQQAAYDLLDSQETKCRNHLTIGRLLHQGAKRQNFEKQLFPVVNQLNLGRTFIQESPEREELAAINLLAGKKALGASASRSALNYFLIGIELLGNVSWERFYNTTLELHVKGAEAATLCGDYEEANRLLEPVLANARTLFHKIPAYEILIQGHFFQNDVSRAVDVGLDALALLEVEIPSQANRTKITLEIIKTRMALRGKTTENLFHLPTCHDRRVLIILRLLSRIGTACYFSRPDIFPIIICEIVRHSITHGNSAHSISGYSCYGFLLGALLDEIEDGYHYGALANRLLDHYEKEKQQQLFLFNSFIRPWKEPLWKSRKPLLEGYRLSIESGDQEFASLCRFSYATILFFSGADLKTCHREFVKLKDIASQFHNKTIESHAHFWADTVTHLTQDNPDTEQQKEQETLVDFAKKEDQWAQFSYACLRTASCYLLDNYQQALTHAKAVEGSLCGQGTVAYQFLLFYESLAMLALYPNASNEKKKQYFKKVMANRKYLHQLANHAAMNHLHRVLLIDAERERVLGNDIQALAFFDQAMTQAAWSKNQLEEALAFELAARFHLKNETSTLGQYFLQKAHFLYKQWGSLSKAHILENRYSIFFETPFADSVLAKPEVNLYPTTSSFTSQSLDLKSVLKASQAIAGEIVLEKLLSQVMKIMVENAGADRAALLLCQEDTWFLEAEAQLVEHKAKGQELALNLTSSIPYQDLSKEDSLPTTVINYCIHTRELLVIQKVNQETRFRRDPYLQKKAPSSLMSMPLLHQGALIGLLYLENASTSDIFHEDRVQVLELLSSQLAISIVNANFYAALEQKVAQRTQELRKRNEEILRTQNQLIMQEKMASLGMLTAGVAHELKNPLNFVTNFSELTADMIEEATDELEKQEGSVFKEYLGQLFVGLKENALKVVTNGQRANTIVESMMVLSKQDPGSWAEIRFNQFVQEYVTLAYHGMLSKQGTLKINTHFELDESIDAVYLQPRNMSRVIVNLVTNALEAVIEKGQKDQEFTPSVKITTRAHDDWVEMRVWDNGIGLDPGAQDKIFTPFVTNKPTGKGNIGLGLTICYDVVVQEHDGKIETESEPMTFTEFIIALPYRRKQG